MRTSESTGQLMKALAEAQGKFPKITKDKTVDTGKYSYSYATLASVLDAIRPVLAEHKIATVQVTDFDDDGRFLLISRLAHESAEWVESRYPLPNDASPQEMGSAITYARRYSACALAGITAEDDDDGQRATSSHKTSSGQREATPSDGSTATVQNDDRALMIRLRRDIRAKAPNHPGIPTLSAMGLNDLKKIAAEVGVLVDSPATNGSEVKGATVSPAPAESPSPEGEGPGINRVDAGSSPEGDWEAHWTMIAEVAGTSVQQIENLLRTLPGGKSIQSLKNLSPHSAPGQKLEKALIGNKGRAT